MKEFGKDEEEESTTTISFFFLCKKEMTWAEKTILPNVSFGAKCEISPALSKLRQLNSFYFSAIVNIAF